MRAIENTDFWLIGELADECASLLPVVFGHLSGSFQQPEGLRAAGVAGFIEMIGCTTNIVTVSIFIIAILPIDITN